MKMCVGAMQLVQLMEGQEPQRHLDSLGGSEKTLGVESHQSGSASHAQCGSILHSPRYQDAKLHDCQSQEGIPLHGSLVLPVTTVTA